MQKGCQWQAFCMLFFCKSEKESKNENTRDIKRKKTKYRKIQHLQYQLFLL